MSQIINVGILILVVVVAALIPQNTEAAEYVVGGAAGWSIPREGASFYSTSVANITFRINDILVFNFNTGAHNVITLSKKDFENCNVNGNIETFASGPARITLNRAGEYYFACGFPSHCSLGQKLNINVTAGSSSLAPQESPPPTVSGAAMSVASTVSVLLMDITINVLELIAVSYS
ncbi:stellacyanin-like [Gastrolobium bilobum]|uniref:stellacyanin-like n=1 Tax=Gastrolobium bilobum TaxID=150636 RepID=UPI002AB188D4|nr:stellacyanin-like [Gastrolobium bilobum]